MEECVSCLETPPDARQVECTHVVLCLSCAVRVFQTTNRCPVCRATMLALPTQRDVSRLTHAQVEDMIGVFRRTVDKPEAENLLRAMDGIVARVPEHLLAAVHGCRLEAFCEASLGSPLEFVEKLLAETPRGHHGNVECVASTVVQAIDSGDAVGAFVEYVRCCPIYSAMRVLDSAKDFKTPRPAIRLAVASLRRQDATEVLASFATKVLVAASELIDDDPTPLREEGVVEALSRSARSPTWHTFDVDIFRVIRVITFEGPVPAHLRESYATLFGFVGRVCGTTFGSGIAWQAVATVLEAVRVGSPSREFYLSTKEAPLVLVEVIVRGHSANTDARRHMFLEYCAFHINARPKDAIVYLRNNGVRAAASCVRVTARFRHHFDRITLACYSGLEEKEREEMLEECNVFMSWL